ncbi:MAG: HU family DNA-binding protein [Candidatus Tectomicrobia bacterium]|nr:HU family DNA-binding protein [Candidatus Tectomicrobia bacterium]
MRKIEIVNRVAGRTGLTKAKAEEAVEAILTQMKAALRAGESVILRRFGSFQIKNKTARMGRNPKTGKAAKIQERKVVRFRGGKQFRDALNSSS